MKQKTAFLLLILTFSISSSLISQEKTGYIITNQNDTIRGTITNETYHTNAFECNFSPLDTLNYTKYYPSDIAGYRFDSGKYYVSKSFKLDNIDTTLFLEYLIDGKLDIYFFQDNAINNRYFVTRDGMRLSELKYSKSYVVIDGENYEKETNKSAGILYALTSDKPEFQSNIDKIKEPSHNKLIKFGEEYHNAICPDTSCLIYHKKMKYKVNLELLGGINLLSYNHQDFSKDVLPTVGLMISINNPNFSENSFFSVGYMQDGKNTEDSTGSSFYNFCIPFTYGYYPTKKTITFGFSAGLNIRSHSKKIYGSLSVVPSLNYNGKKINIRLYTNAEFMSKFIIPYAYYSTNIGMSVIYKLNYEDLRR